MGTTSGKFSQKEFVKNELKNNGFITRNKCLKKYVSRLASYICQLKNEGYEFDSKEIETTNSYGTQKDYIYFWTNRDGSDLETTYIFKFFESGEEDVIEVKAKSIDEACAIFLTTPPIFMEEIFNEVHTKVGAIFTLSEREEFKQLKIKK